MPEENLAWANPAGVGAGGYLQEFQSIEAPAFPGFWPPVIYMGATDYFGSGLSGTFPMLMIGAPAAAWLVKMDAE